MAESKETKVEKEVKKLDDVKKSEENKNALAELEGKKVKPKEKKTEDKKEKVELEREYIVPLRRGSLNVPQYRRAKKATRILKEFIVKHMQVRDRDLKKVKIDMYLNNEIWFRGIKKPAHKVKVKAKKIDGIVYVELAEIPEAVKYKMAWEEKRKLKNAAPKEAPKQAKKKVDHDKNKDGIDDRVEEKEDKKAVAEKAEKMAKMEAKAEKHTAQGKHDKKTMPVRKTLER